MNQRLNVKATRSNRTNKLARLLHIYASMLMLISMLFFTVTGFTLNHRDWWPEAEQAELTELTLPARLAQPDDWQQPMTQADKVRKWLKDEQGVLGNQVSYEWDEDEALMVIDVKRPGGYSLAEVSVNDAEVVLETQHFGAISTLNDLHMGRYSGALWSLFIDLSAVSMLLFTLTGFWLVLPQKKRRQRLYAVATGGGLIMVAGYIWVLTG